MARGVLPLLALLLLGCAAGPSATPQTGTAALQTTAPVPQGTAGSDVAQEAWDYATQQVGAEAPTGCLEAAPGSESENHRGCIWSVLFSGYHDGLTGEQPSPLSLVLGKPPTT
jgi:hypothetical protein